ncbi:GspE/PulE family protein [Roseateles flavus]|uniref:GspE/PulE family protein n=1 Tax=Roseateles flavus TaxID=3149041 RepID=A0ABV0GKK9_9BURK
MTLTQRIAALREQGEADVFGALLRAAPDAQSLADEVGALLSLPTLRIQDLLDMRPRFESLSFPECARRRCAVLDDPALAQVRLLITDPFDTDTLAWARTRFGRIEATLVSTVTFDAWLTHCEGQLTALDALAVAPDARGEPGQAGGAEVLSLRQIGVDDSPSVRFVNSTLYDALKSGASDVHLESDPSGLTVKFRLDGVLTAVSRIDSMELLSQAISRIKVMAQLDIAERRVPQDGRLQIAVNGRMVDVRVSIMPSIHGEDAVLRILDRQYLAQTLAGLTLDKLGFDEVSADRIRALCRKPHGLVLATGPTGSGKTTTLYAAIAETHQTRDKIITIEDPVEYQLSGVLQIPVNERKGLTFARGLRSILRHDPDKILVGEIRDAETAQIAVQSALTGHLVFTTVHANTVFDVVGRFEQFGIDAYTFASAINGVLAQRLLRRLCLHCRTPLQPEQVQALQCSVDVSFERAPQLARAVGCEQCRGTGYAGRFALGELLVLTPGLKALIGARAPQAQIQAEAERNGWRSLRALALQAAWDGHTSLEEVDRVAD